MRWTRAVMAFLAFACLLASCDVGGVEAGTGTIRVRMADPSGAKTIAPEGNVDVTDYRVRLENVDSGDWIESGYVAKDSGFDVFDAGVGHWVAHVEAYAANDGAEGGYVLVGLGESEPVPVYGGDDVQIHVSIDDIVDTLSGDVSIRLMMPSGLDRTGDSFSYSYQVTGLGERDGVSVQSGKRSGVLTKDGHFDLVLTTDDGDVLLLEQGAYMVTVDIEGAGISRSAIEMMRLLGGLPAYGEMDLSSTGPVVPDATGITVRDELGSLIEPATVDGGTVYMLNPGADQEVAITLSIVQDGGVDVQDIIWYVDGSQCVGASFSSADGTWTLPGLQRGRHIIVGAYRGSGRPMEGGSLVLSVIVNDPIDFMPGN